MHANAALSLTQNRQSPAEFRECIFAAAGSKQALNQSRITGSIVDIQHPAAAEHQVKLSSFS
jgi:hypothetical protein